MILVGSSFHSPGEHSPLPVLTLQLNSGLSELSNSRLLIASSAAVEGFTQWHRCHHTEAPAAHTVKPAGQGWLAGLPHSFVWVQSRRLGCYACCFTLQVSVAAASSIPINAHAMFMHTIQRAACCCITAFEYCVRVLYAS